MKVDTPKEVRTINNVVGTIVGATEPGRSVIGLVDIFGFLQEKLKKVICCVCQKKVGNLRKKIETQQKLWTLFKKIIVKTADAAIV